jgi:hypothetical protein
METTKRYENFPAGIVLLSNLVTLTIYGLGLLVIFRVGIIFALFYLLYILILEYRLIRYHCTSCYYWGKTCGFGKGQLSSLFFKKGEVSWFCSKKMTWKDMIPDLLVSLIPLVTGIVLLILKFDLVLLAALLLLLILTTMVTGFIRGKMTCMFCRQRDLGCPADSLFNKDK